MSEPKTETYDRLRKFMSLKPDERDEALFLQVQRIKSHLESEGFLQDVEKLVELMNGTTEKAGLPVQMEDMKAQVKKLVKSNSNLQKALYICTGFFIAIKLYLEFFHKP